MGSEKKSERGAQPQPNNPLHGVTLKTIVEDLVARHGWEGLGERVRVRCFTSDPSIHSSLKFLRKTEWARKEVEALYLADQRSIGRNKPRTERDGESPWGRRG